MLLTSYPHHKDPDKKETGETEKSRGHDGGSRGERDMNVLYYTAVFEKEARGLWAKRCRWPKCGKGKERSHLPGLYHTACQTMEFRSYDLHN